MRRYECFEGGSSKFWEIEEPFVSEQNWVVRVKYGRIGSWGQSHSKVYGREWVARDYYNRKISEKLGKGYTLKSAPPPAPKPVVVAKPKPVCAHYTLVRKSGVYECRDCKSKVEFNEPQANDNTPEFETTVRRFFDLRGRANA